MSVPKILSVFILASLSTSAAFAAVQDRSISPSTRLTELQKGNQVLITDRLTVSPGLFLGNINSRETSTGYGRWCYLSFHNFEEQPSALVAGQKFTINDIAIDHTGMQQFIKITTAEGLTIHCLGGALIKTMKVKRLEKIFNETIKFISP